MKELVRMVDCIVAPTHFLASLVKNVLDLHISVIPYGIDYIKEIPGKSGENLTLGFIGTFMPHKGVHTLIEAIKLLDDNAIRVKIYGDPSHHPNYYSQLTSVADNDKRIEFTGKYDYSEISMILSELDMVVVPSIWWENAPFTIQTSFAYKTPVIASNLGGMSEVVRDGVNGLLFEAGNAENLAEVIRKITTNQGVLNRIRENIISPPRIEEVAFEYEKIYSDLIVKRSFKRVNIDHINNMKEIRKNFAISRDNFFFDFKNKTYKSIKLINMNNLKIITRISKGDTMFQGNLDPYFSVGMSALQCIEIALFIANKKSTDIKNILDFACGYGRVMRIIKAAFPKAVITACELDKEAVDYCAKTFCAIPAYSSKRVSEIKIDDSFDLIWNGSLLTHLDSDLWVEYLRLFESLLNPNGILIFTVHGCLVADKLKKGDNDYYGLDQTGVSKVLKDYEDHGFGYANYCNQSDYGISIASPSWVLSCLENIPNLQVLAYVEHLWGNHQDVVICIKDFEWYRKRESIKLSTTMTLILILIKETRCTSFWLLIPILKILLRNIFILEN
jgi:SAM-dependent methyltransferase